MAEHRMVAEFAADWTGVDSLEARLVNQILGQVGVPEASAPDGIFLTFGAISPPVIIGPPDLIEEQSNAYNGRLPVRPVARIRITREKAGELLEVIQTTIDQYDAQTRAAHAAQASTKEG